MKTINSLFMVAALTMAPAFVNAQWSAIRFDQHNNFNKVHAVNGNNAFFVGQDQMTYDNFFMRSNDGGGTWDSIPLTVGADNFQMTEVFFVDMNNGFLGGRKNNVNQSLKKTIDNGTTWTDITPDPSQVEPISAVYFVNASQGFATCGTTFYATSNGGTTWASSTLTFIPSDLNFLNANVGYASGTFGSNIAVVMKTIDGGVTWTQSLLAQDVNMFVANNALLNVVDANVAFTAMEWTNKLFRTVDGGATWDTMICDSVLQISDFHFNSADSGHVLSAYGQLFSTTDGGLTWALQYATEWGFYGPSIYLNSLCFSDGIGYVCGSSGLIKRFDVDISGIAGHQVETGSMNVFPNPCYGMQNLSIETNGMSGDASLLIMNNLGQVVYTENVTNIENKRLITVSALNLAAGTYTVMLSGEKQKQTARVVIAE